MMELVLALGVLLPPPQEAGALQLEPTPEATLALEMLNRARQDPALEAQRIRNAPALRTPSIPIDWEMFEREVAAFKTAPPLIFDPVLAAAALNHARYTLKHQHFGHEEFPDNAGSTGRFTRDRLEFLKSPLSAVRLSECAFGRALSPEHDHWSNLVDDGPGGTGGMQAGRGHRAALLDPAFRRVGIAYAPWDGRDEFAAVRVFSVGYEGERGIGGVCYLDLDGDRCYDLGEGIGGIEIEIERGTHTRSWNSGAYALTTKHSGKLTLRAHLHDLEFRAEVPAGTANFKFDVDALARVRQAIQKEAKQLKSNSAFAARAAINLAVWRRSLPPLATELEGDEIDRSVRALIEAEAEVERVLEELGRVEAARSAREFTRIYRGSLAEALFAQRAKELGTK